MKAIKQNLYHIMSIIVGTLLLAIATNGVIVPTHQLSGGVTGISLLIHFLLDTNVSLLIILINIPLFVIAYIYLSKTYLTYSLLGMLLFSFWLETTSCIVIPTGNILSTVLVGGIIHGLGTGIIFRCNGSTGGTDILAKIIHKYFSINMATTNFLINCVIIVLSIFFFGIDSAVLTLSTMFISSNVTNFFVDGINRKRTLFIITDDKHYESLSNTLLTELHRGVTMIPAVGAYTSNQKYILFTTISIREVAKAKYIVSQIDPYAFMTVTETSQVIGNGKGFLNIGASE